MGDFFPGSTHTPSLLLVFSPLVRPSEVKSEVPDWGNKVDSGIGLRSTLAKGCPPMVNVLDSTLELDIS